MSNIKEQIKFYTGLLKDNEILLLKSKDSYFKSHYLGSPLNVLTNFSGTEGEAIIEKNGNITIFVDTRYHILVEKQAFKNVSIYKMDLGESFIDAFKNKYKKNTIMHVPSDILLNEYWSLDKYFDLRKYTLEQKFTKNKELDEKSKLFLVNSEIEKNDFNFKVQKLKKTNQNIDRMLVFNLDEISYLTNLRSYQMKYSSNFRSILYLDFSVDDYILFLDKIPSDIKIEGLRFKKLNEFQGFIQSVNSEIYVNINEINLDSFLAIKKIKELKQNNLSLISSIKPKSVIEHLISASRRTDLAIYNFKKQLKEGLSEFDLVEIFENELLKQGARMPSFKTILSINENTASIHYSSYDKNKLLKKESLLLLDCGGYFEGGYATDITRTFYFGNNPKQIYKTIYTNVLKAFFACYISKEINAKKLDLMAREILRPFENDGFYFNYGLGHGIGTSVHQNPPRLSMNSSDIIKPFQTHSIEPGLYGKSKKEKVEFGVRLENCVYSDIEYKKHTLTKFPFEEVLIDYSLLNQEEKDMLDNWQKEFLREI